jgi:hypothetical protein
MVRILKLKGKDAIEFWENEKNPKELTKEQKEFFKDAIRLFKEKPF